MQKDYYFIMVILLLLSLTVLCTVYLISVILLFGNLDNAVVNFLLVITKTNLSDDDK